MTEDEDEDQDRHARIAAIGEAARLERAETLRRLLHGLLRRRSAAKSWPAQPGRPGGC